MSSSRNVTILAAGIAAASLLSGCGSSSGPAAKGTTAARPSAAAASPATAIPSSSPAHARPATLVVAGPKLAAKVKKQLASEGEQMRTVTCPKVTAKSGVSVNCKYTASVAHGRLRVTFTAVHGRSYEINTFMMTVHPS